MESSYWGLISIGRDHDVSKLLIIAFWLNHHIVDNDIIDDVLDIDKLVLCSNIISIMRPMNSLQDIQLNSLPNIMEGKIIGTST